MLFAFRDTQHGNKALLENGVFLEFAIFTEAELAVKNNLKIEDPFNIERCAEQRLEIDFATLVQGYERLEKSLENLLAFAESNFDVNTSIAQAIKKNL